MTPQRIQRSRSKGARLPENTVVVSRPSRFGNPFRVDTYSYNPALFCFKWVDAGLTHESEPVASESAARAHAVAAFRANLLRGTLGYTTDDVVRELRGKNLACWCGLTEQCHADVLLLEANREASPGRRAKKTTDTKGT